MNAEAKFPRTTGAWARLKVAWADLRRAKRRLKAIRYLAKAMDADMATYLEMFVYEPRRIDRTRFGEAVTSSQVKLDAAGHLVAVEAPADRTPRPDHLTRFRPGQSGNPAGRRRGVGNDLLEARRIAAGMYLEVGKRSQGRLVNKALCVSLDVIDGLRDESVEVQSVLAGIRRGRVLQRRLTTPAAAEEALSFYATEWAQPEHPFGMAGPAMVPTHALACDYGERARAALGKREKGRAEA